MQKSNKKKFNKLPKKLSFKEFKLHFLPHLSLPRAGIIPPPERLHSIFNYILYQLDTGCQWEKVPIAVNPDNGKKEIHYTNLWRWFNRWSEDGSFEKAFIASVQLLKDKNKLKFNCINGDGNNSVAKKGAIK
ncbi:MAG: transposase [Candidatus Gribaldobacteria bacterium]|nr:transposase [Candidatus Gribaldobacteria bacterium]